MDQYPRTNFRKTSFNRQLYHVSSKNLHLKTIETDDMKRNIWRSLSDSF